jgi:DNA repair protein RecO (recombination protein O)
LRYVSPKSGRAVSEKGAGDWAERLLPLPPVLRGFMETDAAQIAQGFITTGHFLEAHLARDLGNKPLPEARARYVEAFNRSI